MASIASNQQTVSLREFFLGQQQQMTTKLKSLRKSLSHPVAKGDASEAEWVALLDTYLPKRYQVARAFVVDHRQSVSDCIDIVIFDRHYSPFLLCQNGQYYIPAESVYAAFEVRQDLSSPNLRYAADKVASVRQLVRTSAPIIDKGTRRDPRPLPHILGGLVALEGNLSKRVERTLSSLAGDRFLDFGCVLSGTSFFRDIGTGTLDRSAADDSLIFFFLKLLSSLQSLGTVPPMEIEKYAAALAPRESKE